MKKNHALLTFVVLCLFLMPAKAQLIVNGMFTFSDRGETGTNPKGDLVGYGTQLYGMTSIGGDSGRGYGTIFSIDTNFGVRGYYIDQIVFTGPNGKNPEGSLTLSGDVLYGTTYSGGHKDCGVLFAYKPIKQSPDIPMSISSKFEILHYFDSTSSHPIGNLVASGNLLFGIASGMLFSIHTDGSGYRLIHSCPGHGTLALSSNGKTFYGITQDGSIFAIDTNGTGYTEIFNVGHSTVNFGDGFNGSLILSGKTLVGVSSKGGQGANPDDLFYNRPKMAVSSPSFWPDGKGVLFSIDLDSTGKKSIAQHVLYNFTSDEPHSNTPTVAWNKIFVMCGNRNYQYGYGKNMEQILVCMRLDGTKFSKFDLAPTATSVNYPESSFRCIGSRLYGTTIMAGYGDKILCLFHADDIPLFTEAPKPVAAVPGMLLGNNTVKIGTITWSTTNLNVKTFRNGDVIPEAESKDDWLTASKKGKPAWCYYNNDSTHGTQNEILYNWYAVNDSRGIAPQGWHIASESEWNSLVYYYGGGGYQNPGTSKKLMSTTGWESTDNANNFSNFSALPVGWRFYKGDFLRSAVGTFWTSSKKDKNDARTFWVYDCGFSDAIFGTGYSCRCVKD